MLQLRLQAPCSIALCGSLWLLTGCGATPVQTTAPTPVSAAPLAGGWLLYGTLPPVVLSNSTPAGLVVSFDVTGNNIVGSASFVTKCDSGTQFEGNVSSLLTGTVNADGTFSATTSNLASGSIPTPVLTVRGAVPSQVGGTWAGSYTLTDSDPVCQMNQSASLAAVPIAAVAGTYTGSGSLPGSTGGRVSISLNLQQGAPLYPALGTTPAESALGLTGTVQIQGIPCFSNGAISTTLPSAVSGDRITVSFTMDDGSRVQMLGDLENISSTQVGLALLVVATGQCAGTYSFIPNPLILSR